MPPSWGGRGRDATRAAAAAARVTATVHPSSILRAPSADDRRREMELFVEDLRRVAGWMDGGG